ncbi:MAG: zinc ribbon domain-containing protein [Christensenellales bacterium]|jgi:predicted  nucleic acid-binding Zn-ribbon protein|nr:C4-type zinc ribbon domain-containing protein [Clostridium sp.]MDD7140236.1 C4-type zinc ribbon domain-containing protein [Clostridium sp.]MDO4343034.1 C4-type zinc ribbon domain-containing protein [Eubacteriales bacterium]MDY6080822.1 C4-type zinc ribbon domain-containing protein [Eubacteriales bacterium]
MGKLDAMLLYQQTEQKKLEAEQAVRSTPARQKLSRLHKLLKTQQATIQKLTEETETRLSQINKLSEQAKRLEERIELENSELATITGDEESTAAEMTELRVDIERLQKEINQVVREAKKLLSEAEKAAEEYRETNLTAKNAKKEYDQVRAVCEKERDDSAEMLASFDEKLEQIRKDVDPALFQRYEKVKQHYAAPIVPVIGGKCSGCNMSLPMVMLKRLNAPDAVLECENCGRILYSEQ